MQEGGGVEPVGECGFLPFKPVLCGAAGEGEVLVGDGYFGLRLVHTFLDNVRAATST